MTFCKFSPSYATNTQTLVDNVFIKEFLPSAPDLCVKVYLLGLSKCYNSDEDNTLDFFCQSLKVCEEDIISLFKYWEDLGLVQVLSTNPVEVRYLPVLSKANKVKKYQVDKYADFNIQIQELFGKRLVVPNEYAEFYNLIENHRFTESALIAIVKYCVECKGFNLSPNYCLTVAKDWEREGIHTAEQVNEKIEELGIVDDKMNLILSSMGSKRKVQIEDKELLNKWLNSYGFELNTIIFVIKNIKNKKRKIDVNILDTILTKYFEMRLVAIPEIENYENEKENLYFIATSVNKELGIYYEDLSKEIDTYVVNWLNMGFDAETLKVVADNCFKSSIRTLDGYNNILTKLFKLGINNLTAYMQYLRDNLAIDESIKTILKTLNLMRNVNNMDRNFYSIWTKDWGFTEEIIIYGASLSKDKVNAMQYLNKILSNWNSQGLKTLKQVEQNAPNNNSQNEFIHNNYTKSQIASLISNLDEVEV